MVSKLTARIIQQSLFNSTNTEKLNFGSVLTNVMIFFSALTNEIFVISFYTYTIKLQLAKLELRRLCNKY